ncbi:DUF397 domain-containing protein [Streptomonospora salina]|uniref:DUF397 domain-containing protein n=1 Tax=Streptomonospora salina TaxID=104205 RepID=A0A841E5W9_9ACTN|nr:DUF397 domain-containing protein [Streptomonospora salina]MBB5999297.1 hypothetical protein [Streptomonospora salina]
MDKLRSGWHKSSYSDGGSNCVEVREHVAGANVRDTQNREAGALALPSEAWAAFMAAVRSAEL